jgi:glutamate-1-semialdehyde 2,1-aminomutase
MPVSLTDARSTELYARALQRLPGGVNSPVRAMGAIGRDPVFIERGHGAEIVDVDGNHYVDYVCSWGPLIFGHAHPDVLAAIVAAAEQGTTFGAPTQAEVELAEEIARRVPSVEMVRMTSSGTEASMSAIRLARAATGREKVLKFAGAYHGHVDGLLAQAGSGLATGAIPASPGVTAGATAATVIVPWNDREAVVRATEEHHLAAILAEPFAANMGLVPPETGFLDLLRERASATGALLVFDEVITGFRVAPGGAQELAGVTPDLTVMGKVMGGGLPAAAFGGRADVMARLAPAGPVYQAGTLSGNPLATAAGLATLRGATDEVYARVDHAASAVAELATAALAKEGVPHRLQVAGNLFSIFFTADEVRDFEAAQRQDTKRYAAFFHAALDHGVYLPPSSYEAWFLSASHDDAALDRIAEALPHAARAAAEVG